MVTISRPLGRNAFGEKHDIAAIQAALKNIKIRNKPIWPGRIDGRKTKNLEEAIAIFQAAHRIRVTGKVEPRGPTITAMTRALPRSHAGLRGLKGTPIVFAATMGQREAEQEARVTQSKAPFPDKEARAWRRSRSRPAGSWASVSNASATSSPRKAASPPSWLPWASNGSTPRAAAW